MSVKETEKTESEKNENESSMFVVQAPGKVEDMRNFFRCCGGRQSIYSTYKGARDRLQFRFRPDDSNSIALLSEREPCSDVCVKVIKKKKADGSFAYEFVTVGLLDTRFHFENTICDMQLLPNESGSNFRDELMRPNFFLDFNADNFTSDQSTTLSKHFFFSRFINQRESFINLDLNNTSTPTISHLRKSRKLVAHYINWNDEIPSQAPDDIAHFVKGDHELIGKIGHKFEERPIWSRSALCSLLKCPMSLLKRFLPLHAYFFANGPFRFLWLKYGYDPRLDPSSKIYQAIDIRVRWTGAELALVNGARNYKVPIFKSNQAQYLDLDADGEDDDGKDEKKHIFEPGRASILTTNIYQLGDVHMDEVQSIIHENDGQEEDCTERDGWCVTGAIDAIRRLMVDETSKLLQAKLGEGACTSPQHVNDEQLEITQVEWNLQDCDNPDQADRS